MVLATSNSRMLVMLPWQKPVVRNILKVQVPNFEGVSGSEDRGGDAPISNLLILGGWVTKVLKNGDKKWKDG